jgi:RNA polymerase sigma-70 factor, ECF subfamily
VETWVWIHDARHVRTALQTEDDAFETLYRVNRPIIYAYTLSRLRNPSDAEDVTQTTFLNAYAALHRGVRPRDDLQWLIAIARNVCRDRFRNAKRRPQEEPLEDWTPVPQQVGPEYSVSEIASEIAELQPRHRQVILMHEFEGRSYREISDTLGVSQAAVRALLVRARRTLRDELELGITCAQARRISLRHLNGVAVLDERRALLRHLRKCDECATFVGHRPRSLAGVLLLPTLPFRKLGALLFGTSGAPVGTTAGGGAIAAKVLAVTAIGSTAVGVAVKEVEGPPTLSHSPAAPKTQPAPAPMRHPAVRVQSTRVTTWPSIRGTTKGRVALTHATRKLPSLAQKAPSSDARPIDAPAAQIVHSRAPAVAPVETAAPAVAPEQTASPAVAPVEPAPPQLVAPVDTAHIPPATAQAETSPAVATPPAPAEASASRATAAAAPAAPVTSSAATSASTPTPDPAAAATPPPADAPPASAATADTATSTSAPVVAPPSSAPSPTPTPGTGNGNGNTGNANDSANGVGRDGIPPGQGGAKPEPPAHGRP